MSTPTADQTLRLYVLTRDMRAKQKDYFRTRDSQVLRESKALEAKVDKMLAEIEGGTEQRSLFDG